MPDIEAPPDTTPASPPPAMHPMDPSRGQDLSPKFVALLCWALGVEPLTEPAITGVVVSGECVFAATTDDLFFNALIGSWSDLEANLRGWGDACGADPSMVDGLVAKLRRTGRSASPISPRATIATATPSSSSIRGPAVRQAMPCPYTPAARRSPRESISGPTRQST